MTVARGLTDIFAGIAPAILAAPFVVARATAPRRSGWRLATVAGAEHRVAAPARDQSGSRRAGQEQRAAAATAA